VVLTWNAILPALGIPGRLRLPALVVGGVLIILFSLERIGSLAARPTAR
jgi:TRAP-type C4-dicarboxylate transport system permease small subunit